MFDTVGDNKIECSEAIDVIRSLEFNPHTADVKKVVDDVDPKGTVNTIALADLFRGSSDH